MMIYKSKCTRNVVFNRAKFTQMITNISLLICTFNVDGLTLVKYNDLQSVFRFE